MRGHEGVSHAPFGTQFPKKYSRISPDDTGRSGNLYQYQTTLDQRISPSYSVVQLRQQRLFPQMYQPEPSVIEDKREQRLEQKKDELKKEINQEKKKKVDILMDEMTAEMKDKGKIKRKDMLKALDSVAHNVV